MDNLNQQLEKAIVNVLQDYLEFIGNNLNGNLQLIIDEKQKHYLLVETGWQGNRRIYGTLIHLDIINHKIWIQQDGTEEGVATDIGTLISRSENISRPMITGTKTSVRRVAVLYKQGANAEEIARRLQHCVV